MAIYQQGMYQLENPDKYVGDQESIRYMSSWELRVHQFFDRNPNILKWSSEPIGIPYVKPTTQRIHEYFVDYWVLYVDKEGMVCEEFIEVKPAAQTRPSRARNPRTKQQQMITYQVNQAKWNAAVRWCEEKTKVSGRNITFRILTEQEIFK